MANTLKTNAPAPVETVARIVVADAVRAYASSAIVATRSLVDMIVTGSLVYLYGKHMSPQETAKDADHWDKVLREVLTDAAPGKAESTMHAYVTTSRKLATKLVTLHGYGDIMSTLRDAKTVKNAHHSLIQYLNTNKDAAAFKAGSNLDGLKAYLGVAGSNDKVNQKKEAQEYADKHGGDWKAAHAAVMKDVDATSDVSRKQWLLAVAKYVGEEMAKVPVADKAKAFATALTTETEKDGADTRAIADTVTKEMPQKMLADVAESSIARVTKVTEAEAIAIQAVTRYYEIAGYDKAEGMLKRALALIEKAQSDKDKVKAVPVPPAPKAKGQAKRDGVAAIVN